MSAGTFSCAQSTVCPLQKVHQVGIRTQPTLFMDMHAPSPKQALIKPGKRRGI